jgi:hypothetical protein
VATQGFELELGTVVRRTVYADGWVSPFAWVRPPSADADADAPAPTLPPPPNTVTTVPADADATFAAPVIQTGGEVITPTLATFPITAAAALARPDIIDVNGTDDNGKAVNVNVADTTVDLRDYIGLGYNDFDSGRDTNRCVAECGTAHGTNNKCIRINPSYNPPAVPPRTVVIGGKLVMDQSAGLPWEVMKHGRDIQDTINSGGNYSGGPLSWDGTGLLLEVRDDSWTAVFGARLDNTMDGITFRGADGSIAYVRDTYIGRAHDTMFTSEKGTRPNFFDCCFVGSYGLVDWKGGPNISGSVGCTMEACVISLEPLPGGFKTPYDYTDPNNPINESVHDDLWKADGNSPGLSMRRCVIKVGPTMRGNGAANLPTGSGSTYEDVRLLWDSDQPFPGSTPPAGVTLVNGDGNSRPAVQSEWAAVLAGWKTRHGFTDIDTVDMAKMLDPDPPQWPMG